MKAVKFSLSDIMLQKYSFYNFGFHFINLLFGKIEETGFRLQFIHSLIRFVFTVICSECFMICSNYTVCYIPLYRFSNKMLNSNYYKFNTSFDNS